MAVSHDLREADSYDNAIWWSKLSGKPITAPISRAYRAALFETS